MWLIVLLSVLFLIFSPLIIAVIFARRRSPDMTDVEYHYAGFGQRFRADLIDGLAALGIAFPFWLVFDKLMRNAGTDVFIGRTGTWGVSRFILLAVALYNMTYLVGKTGQSWGRKRGDLRVVDYQGNSIGFWKALLRNILAGSISSIFYHAVVADFAVAVALRDGHVDRFFADI